MKAKKEPTLLIPPAMGDVDRWIVLGLDPSLSRTGYAILDVQKSYENDAGAHPNDPPAQVVGTDGKWIKIGSVKPEESSDPIWVRGKAMALYLRQMLVNLMAQRSGWCGKHDYNEPDGSCTCSSRPRYGLIISMEYPTPRNDFLVALNRIIHLVFFEENHLSQYFSRIHVLQTNASTLRSLMGLTKKGSKNKEENKDKAWEFAYKKSYPELDSDACDGVLLAMMGRHVASIILGHPNEVPDRFKLSLCNGEKDTKGKGRNERVITKGILHRKEYWYPYQRKDYVIATKDASSPTKKLNKITITL